MANEQILIEGIGGVGGVIATRLIRAGHEVTLVTANPHITAAIAADGLHLTTPDGSVHARAQVFTHLADLAADARFDAAYLAMKANSVVEAARATLPWLKTGAYVLTLQNGIVEEAVAAAIGSERIIGGIVSWGGTMHAPGHYEQTSPGRIHVGELNGGLTPRLQRLGEMLARVAPVDITRNIRGALWSQLTINCTITTLGALTGDLLGDMLRDGRMRGLFRRTYAEVVETADGLGIHLERIAAHPRLLYVSPRALPPLRWAKDMMAQMVGRRYGGVKSSMLQSLERGRPSEILFLNGYVVEQARKVNVPTPVNAALVRFVQEIEAGQRTINRRNMDELLQVVGSR